VALGGKSLMEPMDIPGVGRMAVIQDPQGAVLNLMTYS
jgi:predicted enzyme related to lactoylglutathione lyase